jgi:hypothetical protein
MGVVVDNMVLGWVLCSTLTPAVNSYSAFSSHPIIDAIYSGWRQRRLITNSQKELRLHNHYEPLSAVFECCSRWYI